MEIKSFDEKKSSSLHLLKMAGMITFDMIYDFELIDFTQLLYTLVH